MKNNLNQIETDQRSVSKWDSKMSRDLKQGHGSYPKQNISELLRLADFNAIEDKLKLFWTEYIEQFEKQGWNDDTKVLKERYFQLYHIYRRNKIWKRQIAE